ncbi:Protein-methionine sulfoxide oxidase mical2b [Dissostichus eleginoides]|uniref:Protein-methionine sulfoxide oxidase mical2b n=1 Tax=Dissostichus eleginoides TaxID=100907 RepID=A0AAD9F3U5_DISEL|nr:Protein-methionine sulfoxide oxidase mical2b [Dissostichus eleginoides]
MLTSLLCGALSLHSERMKVDEGEKKIPEETKMDVEALDDSCLAKAAAPDPTGANGQNQDGTKDHSNPKQNNRWKRKIKATLPLIFIKHFQRGWTQDRDGPESVPEADSDFEEITEAVKHTNSDATSKTPAVAQNASDESEKSEECAPEKDPAVCSPSAPKKRLVLSQSEKEKLLSWDIQAAPEETGVPAEADKLQPDSGQDEETPPSQPSAPPSTFQFIANAFRRRFSVTHPSSRTNTAVTMRSKCDDGPRKQRAVSEGALSFSSLFSTAAPEPSTEEKISKHQARVGSVWANPWGAGRDLPSLLQQVSLKGRRDSGGVFSDDMASLPGKKLNLFSSLRLRKREESESEGRDQEIKTILTNLRNKASSQQNLDEPSSSDDEDENLTSNQKRCPKRQRRKQEKTVAQQAKREQLKRLHRAQTIQRQLEEVAEKQRDLEERGVSIEKIIRGETDSPEVSESDEAQLYQSWFQLVLEKNRLARYESELMIFAQELELVDSQSRMQQDLRRRMAIEDTDKSASELQREQEILADIMRTVEKRDMLVSLLEEQRLKERAEDRDLESLVLSKGHEFHWAQVEDSWGPEKLA